MTCLLQGCFGSCFAQGLVGDSGPLRQSLAQPPAGFDHLVAKIVAQQSTTWTRAPAFLTISRTCYWNRKQSKLCKLQARQDAQSEEHADLHVEQQEQPEEQHVPPEMIF